MIDVSKEAMDRISKKGWRAHFGLRDGSMIHVNGEKPVRLSEGISDNAWDWWKLCYLRLPADIYYVDSTGRAEVKLK